MEVNVYTVNCLHYPFNTALRADCKSGASDDLAPTLMKTIDMLVSFIDKVMLLVFINQLVAPLRQIKLWSSILFLEKIRWTWEEALGRSASDVTGLSPRAASTIIKVCLVLIAI